MVEKVYTYFMILGKITNQREYIPMKQKNKSAQSPVIFVHAKNINVWFHQDAD